MNSHFQSSEATWTRSGFTVDAIGLRGLKSCEPTHATPPTRNTVMAGDGQTGKSRQPGNAKVCPKTAHPIDGRHQKTNTTRAPHSGDPKHPREARPVKTKFPP